MGISEKTADAGGGDIYIFIIFCSISRGDREGFRYGATESQRAAQPSMNPVQPLYRTVPRKRKA